MSDKEESSRLLEKLTGRQKLFYAALLEHASYDPDPLRDEQLHDQNFLEGLLAPKDAFFRIHGLISQIENLIKSPEEWNDPRIDRNLRRLDAFVQEFHTKLKSFNAEGYIFGSMVHGKVQKGDLDLIIAVPGPTVPDFLQKQVENWFSNNENEFANDVTFFPLHDWIAASHTDEVFVDPWLAASFFNWTWDASQILWSHTTGLQNDNFSFKFKKKILSVAKDPIIAAQIYANLSSTLNHIQRRSILPL